MSRGRYSQNLSQWRTRCTALLMAFCTVVAGCSDGPFSCTAESVPGIEVKVLDAETGHPAACGAVAWLVSGSWSEEMDASWGCTEPDTLQSPWLRGAYERAGNYSVLVLKDGYIPWSRSGLRVFEDECHVHTIRLEARLERNR